MNRILKYIVVGFLLWALCYFFIEKYDPEIWILVLVPSVISVAITMALSSKLKNKQFNQLLFVSLFLFIIYTPMLGRKQETSLEKRKLTEFPTLKVSNVWKFFYEFQNYFNDRFAFRNKAVETIGLFRLSLFKVSSVPHLIEVGKNGWLFSSKEDHVKDTATPFTKEQLDTVELNLEMITKYLDQYDIKYYFALIPTKEHIYPEYMHELLKYRMRFSKEAQLNERIRNNKNIRSIDVRDVLIKGKPVRNTYSTIDTHWNEYGCFLAYREVIKRINQDFPSIVGTKQEDYTIQTIRTDEGDQQFLMGFRKHFYFNVYKYVPKSGISPYEVDSTYNDVPASWKYSTMKMPGSNTGLKLVVIRDSFGEFMKLFISRDFDETQLIWTPNVPVTKVLSLKPDVVYHQLAEPLIMHALKLPEEIAKDTSFLKKYYPDYKAN